MGLSRKKRYLQIALNSTLGEAKKIISLLPPSEKILIEAGTPLIKKYGSQAIASIRLWWETRVFNLGFSPYIVADLKCMDRGKTEVEFAAKAGASAAVVLGQAPKETIEVFIKTCGIFGLDSMIDMMNVDEPVKVLRRLSFLPTAVILHRGVDEDVFNPDKPLPYAQINKIRSSFDCLISIAGGDSIREVQRAVFNGADIVVVWKEFYQSTQNIEEIAKAFLKEIK